MIAKGTAIFVEEHQCVSQEIKVINFDGILINDNGENISVPLKPVSYTHLDVYKRQGYKCRACQRT